MAVAVWNRASRACRGRGERRHIARRSARARRRAAHGRPSGSGRPCANGTCRVEPASRTARCRRELSPPETTSSGNLQRGQVGAIVATDHAAPERKHGAAGKRRRSACVRGREVRDRRRMDRRGCREPGAPTTHSAKSARILRFESAFHRRRGKPPNSRSDQSGIVSIAATGRPARCRETRSRRSCAGTRGWSARPGHGPTSTAAFAARMR